MNELPYLTKDMPGVGGAIKDEPEDFRVEEIPLYPPSGSGTHLFFRIRKMGVPTTAAVERIARFMGVRPHDVGVAGLKDAKALTTQWLSLEHADADKLAKFGDSQIQILEVTRHNNKLRPGHLAGNRFDIRIRGVGPRELERAKAILEILERRGVPNYFGEQRFGARGDTARLGEALVRDDLQEFVNLFLGRSLPGDPPDCRAARDAFDAGFFQRALDRWPRHYFDQRRALAAYKRNKRPVQAVLAVDKRLKRLFVSAFQSEIFNEVLAARIDAIDRLLPGDLAVKEDSGGAFAVADAAAEQPRAERWEISPSGPIIGFRSALATGEPGRIEQEALTRHNITADHFRNVGTLKVNGSRRSLRFRIEQSNLTAGQDGRGTFLRLSFLAPSGCYATVLLREIMKQATGSRQ